MKKDIKKVNISILGAGSWGGTLANLLSNKNYSVNLWTPSINEYNQIKKSNTLLKPTKYKLNKNIIITQDLPKIAKTSDVIILAVPTHAFEATLKKLKEYKLPKSTIILSATKGITIKDNKRPSYIANKVLPHNKIAVLSGPNIALDVLSKTPIISIIASKDIKTAQFLQKIISSKLFRIYTNNDIVGVETAGALKNVIAIGSGISDGLGLSISTKAALISRGLIEIARVTVKEGGDPKTLLGAAGIGDLIATCCSTNSRNYRVGYMLAKGNNLKKILNDLGQTAEGVETVKSMMNLAKKYKLDLPIANSIYKVVVQNKNAKNVLNDLISRPLAGHEFDF